VRLMTLEYDPLPEADVVRLIQVLCVDFGFCLTVDEAKRLQTNPPRTVDAFTQAVFTADGQDPALAGAEFYARVESAVAASFERKSGVDQKQPYEDVVHCWASSDQGAVLIKGIALPGHDPIKLSAQQAEELAHRLLALAAELK
jgi:hypothetical protein